MMFIDNKEEVGTQGQRLNEPNIGVPIKKRPFQLTNPSSLESNVQALDKFSLMPKHFTPRSSLDFSPLGFDPGNPSSSNLDKPAGVDTNPVHDLNAIDMERNYCPLKSSASSDFGMEMLQDGNAPKLQLSLSGNTMKEKIIQCSTDLSLTGPSTISSKACFKPSHNLSKNMEKKSVFDLNLPTAETWDSAMDRFTSENNSIAHTEPVEVPAKQGNVSRMIPHGMCSGVFSNGVVAGLVPKEAVNNLKLPNTMGKSSEKCNPSEVTLDLQLKLPPRPELRMKDLEPVCSSDLSLSLSGNDLNSSPEPVNVKPKQVEISQKSEDKDINNPNVKPVAQKQAIVKQESPEVTLPQKVMQASVLKNQSFASGSVVKKESVDIVSHDQHPLGKLLDKSPCPASESRLAKQAEISETNNLTKGIDLNTATPLPEVSTGGKTINPVLAERVAAGQIFQPATSQSDVCHKSENMENRKLSLNMPCLTTTVSPLVGTEDIKPVIIPSASPASVVDNGKRMASTASDGLSQGSADMDCSEEGQNLPKSANTGKTTEDTICETNASSSSSFAKIFKQESNITGEFENVGIIETNENVSLVHLSIPNSKENQIQTPTPVEASSVQNNESNIASSSTKQIDLPNKNIQSVCLEMEAGGSKSRSPSISKSIRDKDVDLSSERENDPSHGQTDGNGIMRSRFKRTYFGLDRAQQFERKKSRWSSWDEGSNIHSNRDQRWEGHRFSQFDGDRFENEDNLSRRAGINMINGKRQTNRFYNRFGHNKYNGFRFARTNSNSDMNFDEGNDCRNNRHRPHFQNRRRITDVSPRGADELDAPVFERCNHYRRVDHTISRERSSSPGPRRGLHQWTPPGEMVDGHPNLLTRVDTQVRSPGRRPFFKKDNLNRRHVSPQYNRARKPGRGMHWNNGRHRYDRVGPYGPVADAQDLEAYGEHCHGGEMMQFHGRYPDNDGAYSDGGGPHGRVRNYETAMSRPREVGDQDEYRYNNRVLHGRRDANPNNNSDESKRRRF